MFVMVALNSDKHTYLKGAFPAFFFCLQLGQNVAAMFLTDTRKRKHAKLVEWPQFLKIA